MHAQLAGRKSDHATSSSHCIMAFDVMRRHTLQLYEHSGLYQVRMYVKQNLGYIGFAQLQASL